MKPERLPLVGDVWLPKSQYTQEFYAKVTATFAVRQADSSYQNVVRARIVHSINGNNVTIYTQRDAFMRDYKLTETRS